MIFRSLTVPLLVFVLLTAVSFGSIVGATVFRVSNSADTPDATPGDGLCADISGNCTLRAAVMESAHSATDSVIISSDIGAIYLRLGAIVVTSPNLTIVAENDPTEIDGSLNPEGTDLFEIAGQNCKLSGLAILHSRRHGIRVRANGARIGSAENTTIVAGNGMADTLSSGIFIDGVFDAEIANVWIGVAGNGTITEGNQRGIWVRSSSGIKIGGNSAAKRNVISGNCSYGILIDGGSADIAVQGNIVGLDVTGRTLSPNRQDGIRISGGSHAVIIGGTSGPERNIISANLQSGIAILGPETRDILVAANFVGLDSTGFFETGNSGAGVLVAEGAINNRIGKDSAGSAPRLVIAGSGGNGIEIRGARTDSNVVDWTLIGTDSRGDSDRPNGRDHGQGVAIFGGAKYNRIGSGNPGPRNIIDGNFGAGIAIYGNGTDSNGVLGNYIGVYRLGNAPFGNSAGLVIRDSARYNTIGAPGGGNLISGNRGDLFPLGAGVVIFGERTEFNVVQNNLIGTDYTGTRAIRNLSAGVIIGGGASRNLIGGDTSTGNQISGNGTSPLLRALAAGIHVFGVGTDSNVIAGNLIGVAADGVTPLGNTGHGIGVYAGAAHTVLGGDSASAGNTIARNKYAAVWLEGNGTDGNFVRYNSIVSNDSGGIVLAGGANGGLTPPTLLGSSIDSAWGTAEVGATIDLYTAQVGATSGIQGSKFVGTATAKSDGSFTCHISDEAAGSKLTAVQSVQAVGSSPFSLPVTVSEAVSQPLDPATQIQFRLYQNVPNPFNSNTIISFTLVEADSPELAIYNISGQRVRCITESFLPPGRHVFEWDGTNDRGEAVSSGTYFYRLTTKEGAITKKMVLLK